MKRVALIFLILALPLLCRAAVIFSDDFESDPSDWTCSDGQLSQWSPGELQCTSTVGFGDEFTMGAGHLSNNAVYFWKKNILALSQARCHDDKWLYGADAKREVYLRWYMKVPPAAQFDKACASGFKFWRFILRETGISPGPEFYLNVSGATFATGTLGIWYNATSQWGDLMPVSSFNDGNWHCHELHIKCNSTATTADGVVEYWLDGGIAGTPNTSLTGLILYPVNSAAIHRTGLGMGNTTEETPFYQSNWTAIAFDDYVLSTTYNGLIGGAPTAPTSVPTVGVGGFRTW